LDSSALLSVSAPNLKARPTLTAKKILPAMLSWFTVGHLTRINHKMYNKYCG